MVNTLIGITPKMSAIHETFCVDIQLSTYLNMEEAGPGDVGHRRSDLLPRVDNIDPKGIHRIPSDVIPIHTGDQYLSLVIVHKQSADHLELLSSCQSHLSCKQRLFLFSA